MRQLLVARASSNFDHVRRSEPLALSNFIHVSSKFDHVRGKKALESSNFDHVRYSEALASSKFVRTHLILSRTPTDRLRRCARPPLRSI